MSAYQLDGSDFDDARSLEQPLLKVLERISADITKAGANAARLFVLPPKDVLVVANTPGADPWPLRLAQVAGAPLGAILIRCENLTTPGSNGVPTAAVSITSQRVEGGTVFVDFVSGLTVASRYRLVFGVLNAS